jgi:hypothetical protein
VGDDGQPPKKYSGQKEKGDQMTTETLFGPSEKQIKFINDLLDEKELEPETVVGFRTALATMDKKAASSLIDLLIRLPKKENKVVGGSKSALQEALLKAPKSKYAVPNVELDMSLTDATKLTGDHLFIELKEYMGNLYMRRLHGAVGAFTRTRVANDDAVTIMNHISKDPYKYAKIFGTIYSCCGSCGAELTDPISRELQLGPECRKKFGK